MKKLLFASLLTAAVVFAQATGGSPGKLRKIPETTQTTTNTKTKSHTKSGKKGKKGKKVSSEGTTPPAK